MFNMIRGDFYRLRHSKGFYITEFILIVLILVSISTGTLGSVGISSEGVNEFQQKDVIWTAVLAMKLMTSMNSFLIYLILPLFIMTTGFEFSRQSYKNLLSSGMTRVNYFISKYAVFLLIVVLQFVLYYGITFNGASLKNGIGDWTARFGIKIAQTISFQLLLMVAIFAISIFVLFLTFSTIAAIVTTIIFPLIIEIIHAIFSKTDWLKYFDFQISIDSAYFTHLSTNTLAIYILTACGTIIILGLLSIFIFKRKNL